MTMEPIVLKRGNASHRPNGRICRAGNDRPAARRPYSHDGSLTCQMLPGVLSRRRDPVVVRIDDHAAKAIFMASDKASGMTGTTVNLSMGTLDD